VNSFPKNRIASHGLRNNKVNDIYCPSQDHTLQNQKLSVGSWQMSTRKTRNSSGFKWLESVHPEMRYFVQGQEG
jgi:hypothetical protein